MYHKAVSSYCVTYACNLELTLYECLVFNEIYAPLSFFFFLIELL